MFQRIAVRNNPDLTKNVYYENKKKTVISQFHISY